ncbi:hypothetical protein PENSPDRAFT_679227 [Peniophora sp. CONT]|nr:hypothetical protein PENSPDRAFT_679227 [Peniophora sp. CONT]
MSLLWPLLPVLPPQFAQSVCNLSCDHPLPYWDCFARIIARCLHRRFPFASPDLLFYVVFSAISLGWYIRDVTADDVAPGDLIERRLTADLVLHATVGGLVVHDHSYAIFACVLTRITCGPSTIFITPRLLFLKVPRTAVAKLVLCNPNHCDCAIRIQGVDEQVLEATAHRLTGSNHFLRPSAAALIPLVNAALISARAPSQFVKAYSELPGTQIIGDANSHHPHQLVLPAIIENPECAFPPGVSECLCPPTPVGESEAIEDPFLAITEDEELLHFSGETLWEFLAPSN